MRGRGSGDRREPTRERRALAWEGVTRTASGASRPLPVFKTVSRLPDRTKPDPVRLKETHCRWPRGSDPIRILYSAPLSKARVEDPVPTALIYLHWDD